ncbi:MAG: hypothetical protein AUK47_13510 [Deltaproteobacteria bacterium CG2_30_63_29]|nr:MAG: hypothetical protein AUK47_13510 [Deltaproteobacteria bacterium CG2_30_63_29]PJB39750.1 MAG: hypothetical protein CO108_16525 [Deltaproteobacteria bacterium CG_4_9_14_3_um_filter_63_12]
MSEKRARILVLGGSGAIGAAVVEALAAEGAAVVASFHRGREVAEGLVGKGSALAAVHLDLAEVEALRRGVSAAVDSLGGLDGVVFCAGVAPSTQPLAALPSLESLTPESWQRHADVELRGLVFAMQAVAPHLREGGNIVVLASLDAAKPVPAPLLSTSAQGAKAALARTLAKSLGPHNIRVNVVAAGLLEVGASQLLPRSLVDDFVAHCAAGRLGQVREIADVLTWFALENTYVNGQCVVVDGGI